LVGLGATTYACYICKKKKWHTTEGYTSAIYTGITGILLINLFKNKKIKIQQPRHPHAIYFS
jgi:hypothetical protein